VRLIAECRYRLIPCPLTYRQCRFNSLSGHAGSSLKLDGGRFLGTSASTGEWPLLPTPNAGFGSVAVLHQGLSSARSGQSSASPNAPESRRSLMLRQHYWSANHLITTHQIVSGIVMPSALAAMRLTTSSILVGRSIGKSSGFAPLRILST
jgi:hypothetical protein